MKVEDLKLDAQGLIPCVVQQYDTGEVLMVAWMNAESVALTLETGTTWFWSRSRQELWNKGATSGNMQQLRRRHPVGARRLAWSCVPYRQPHLLF